MLREFRYVLMADDGGTMFVVDLFTSLELAEKRKDVLTLPVRDGTTNFFVWELATPHVALV